MNTHEETADTTDHNDTTGEVQTKHIGHGHKTFKLNRKHDETQTCHKLDNKNHFDMEHDS